MTGYGGSEYASGAYLGGAGGSVPPPPPEPPPPPAELADFPTIVVEYSQSGPMAAPQWAPIVGCVREIEIRRGRSDETSEWDAGTATIVLRNDDRAFDPQNTASAFHGYLTTNRRVRVSATWDGETHALFDGFADAWLQVPGDTANNYAECRLVLTDVFKILARLRMEAVAALVLDDATDGELDVARLGGRFEFEPEQAASRAEAILETVGVPADLYAIDATGTVLVADRPEREGNPLDYLRRIAASIGGDLVCMPDGAVALWDRNHWSRDPDQSQSTGLWADLPGAWAYKYVSVELVQQSENTLANIVERGRGDDVTFRKRNAASVATYGPVEDSRVDLLTADANEIAAQVEATLDRYADPRPRVANLEIVPRRDPASYFPQVLARDLGDRFTLTRTLAGTGSAYTAEYQIESIAHTIAPQQWLTTWSATLAADTAGFVLGSSVLDTGTLAY